VNVPKSTFVFLESILLTRLVLASVNKQPAEFAVLLSLFYAGHSCALERRMLGKRTSDTEGSDVDVVYILRNSNR
jgi:hypothetical protein